MDGQVRARGEGRSRRGVSPEPARSRRDPDAGPRFVPPELPKAIERSGEGFYRLSRE